MALGKKLRNRVIGALVLVALAMILIPAVMDPGQVYKKSENSIAVNAHGAVTDEAGRMIEGGQDYSDLLAPIEDSGVSPEVLAAENSAKHAITDQGTLSSGNAGTSSSASLDLLVPPESTQVAIPDDPQAQVQR